MKRTLDHGWTQLNCRFSCSFSQFPSTNIVSYWSNHITQRYVLFRLRRCKIYNRSVHRSTYNCLHIYYDVWHKPGDMKRTLYGSLNISITTFTLQLAELCTKPMNELVSLEASRHTVLFQQMYFNVKEAHYVIDRRENIEQHLQQSLRSTLATRHIKYI